MKCCFGLFVERIWTTPLVSQHSQNPVLLIHLSVSSCGIATNMRMHKRLSEVHAHYWHMNSEPHQIAGSVSNSQCAAERCQKDLLLPRGYREKSHSMLFPLLQKLLPWAPDMTCSDTRMALLGTAQADLRGTPALTLPHWRKCRSRTQEPTAVGLPSPTILISNPGLAHKWWNWGGPSQDPLLLEWTLYSLGSGWLHNSVN